MKATRYFDEQVRRKRPYLTDAMCEAVLAAPVRRETQGDGRVRLWGPVVLPREAETRTLRVVTLEDGETVHNAFLDRGYRQEEP